MRKTTEEWRPLKVIGSTVKALRTAQGLTQGQLAARADMHENYVWGIESGLRNVSAINLLHLAAALQVHPSELWREFKISDLKRLPEKSAARLRYGADTTRSKR